MNKTWFLVKIWYLVKIQKIKISLTEIYKKKIIFWIWIGQKIYESIILYSYLKIIKIWK